MPVKILFFPVKSLFCLILVFVAINLKAQKVRLVADFDTTPGQAHPRAPFIFRDKLYFRADDAIYNNSLWAIDRSDKAVRHEELKFFGTPFIYNDLMYFDTDGQWFFCDGIHTPEKVKSGLHQPVYCFNNKILCWEQTKANSSCFWLYDGINLKQVKPSLTRDVSFLGELNHRLYFKVWADSALWTLDVKDSLLMVSDQYLKTVNFAFIMKNSMYFTSPDSAQDWYTLWKSDGIQAPEKIGRIPKFIDDRIIINDTMYFDRNVDPYLWVFDGTNLSKIEKFQGVDELINFNNKLYFTATYNDFTSVWSFDNLNEPVKFPGHSSEWAYSFLGQIDSDLYITDEVTKKVFKLSTTGEVTQTYAFGSQSLPDKSGFIQIFNHAFYYGNNNEIYKFDGSSQPFLVAKICRQTLGSTPENLIVLNNKLYFTSTIHYSPRFMVYDGLNTPVKAPGFYGYASTSMQNLMKSIFYVGSCGKTFCSLLAYDGQEASWVESFYDISELVELDSTVYFGYHGSFDNMGFHLYNLYGYNYREGTFKAPDTELVKFKSTPDNLYSYEHSLFFTAQDSTGVNRMWKYKPNQKPVAFTPVRQAYHLTGYNGRVYFTDIDSAGPELWMTDGFNPAERITNFNPGAYGTEALGTNLSKFIVFKGRLLFLVNDGIHGSELWSLGTDNIPQLVDDIYPGPHSSNIDNYIVFDNYLYFTADDSLHGTEWWKVDSTGTTELVFDLFKGTSSSWPLSPVIRNGILFFSADDGIHGRELWQFDGIKPTLAADIYPGVESSSPSGLIVFDDRICFQATDATSGMELFEYFPDVHEVYNKNLVACDSMISPSGNYIWKTPGVYADTVKGYQAVDSILNINLTINHNSFSQLVLTVCDSMISPGGTQVWKQDGQYKDTLVSGCGCDSIITVNLSVDHVNTGIIQDQAVLTSLQEGGMYQWIDAGNGNTPITGAINPEFTAISNGLYAVIVSEGVCVDTSEAYEVILTGLPGQANNRVLVYPNPAGEFVTIDAAKTYENAVITLLTNEGKVIRKEQFHNSRYMKMNLTGQPGAYYLMIDAGENRTVYKVMKK